jgi:hypothetical protein
MGILGTFVFLLVGVPCVLAGPSEPALFIFGLLCLAWVPFHLYLFWINRRLVVSLIDEHLMWNTHSLFYRPLQSVAVAKIQGYRVETSPEGPIYTGSIYADGVWQKLGSFEMHEHRHFYAAMLALNPSIQWQEIGLHEVRVSTPGESAEESARR